MADRPRPDDRPAAPRDGGPRPPPPPARHPRASGSLPWDLEARTRYQRPPQEQLTSGSGQEQLSAGHEQVAAGQEQLSAGHEQVAASYERLSAGHERLTAGYERLSAGHERLGAGHEQVVASLTQEEENALLEELDEVLSSTTGSKASSKATTDSRVTSESVRSDPVLSEVGQADLYTSEIEEENGLLSQSKTDLVDVDNGNPSNATEVLCPVNQHVEVSEPQTPALGHIDPDTSKEGQGDPDMSKVDRNEEQVKMWSTENEDLSVQGQGFGRQESSLDSRTPRYHGQFSNYEEMLDNLDEQDPFKGQRPPVSDRKPPSRSAADRPRHSRANNPKSHKNHFEKRKNLENSQEKPDSNYDSKRARRLNKSKSEDVHDRPVRTGVTNPVYEQSRRDSVDSTKTYIVGRTDSRVALVDDPNDSKSSTNKKGKLSPGGPSVVRSSIPNLLATVDFMGIVPREPRRENSLPYGPDERTTKHFIRSTFRHRQCSKFIPDQKDETKCGCGRNKVSHPAIGVPDVLPKDPSLKWNSKEHTSYIEANSFGTIAFHGFGQEIQRFAPYIRLDESLRQSSESLQTVWELLCDVWELPRPKMLVSVTGGAKRFFMKNRLKNSFKRGLINVATSSGAWIITGGTGTGVMQFVGEAVRDHQLTAGGVTGQPVVALGIATWGIVDNKQALISEGHGSFPAHYSIEHLASQKRTAPLDPNHTHFLLIDDGSHRQFGKEIQFRAAFESFISNHLVTGVSQAQRVHVPVVLLVLEGGTNTLETVVRALENKTPVVIIQGSGRAADFIAMAYKEIRGWDDESKLQMDEDIQKMRAENMFEWRDESEKETGVQKCLASLKKILNHHYRARVTVFHMDDVDTTKEIDEAILFALLKAKKSDAQQQLNLALAWNRCDVARQQIFDLENRGNWQTLDLNTSTKTALLEDRPDFVQLFMDNGVDLSKFLTKNTLRLLYSEVVNNKYSGAASRLLRHLLQEAQKGYQSGDMAFRPKLLLVGPLVCFRREEWGRDMPNLLRVVGRVINALLGEHQENLYKDPKYIITYEQQQRETDTKSVVSSSDARLTTVATTRQDSLQMMPDKPLPAHMKLYAHQTRRLQAREVEEDEDFDVPERDLFLWAILLNRQDLARLFWRAGQDHIGGALVASSILKSLADQADDEEELDLAQDLLKHSEEWEEVAVGVLNECYQRDKDMSHDLLVRENPTWGNSTLFVMADSSEQMEFMGHSCCQTKLNRIWKGKMALYTPMWKILLSMFLPIFLPLVRFSTMDFAGRFRPRDKSNEEMESKTIYGSTNQVRPEEKRDLRLEDDDDDAPEFVRSATRRRHRRSLAARGGERVDMFSDCSGRKPMTFLGVILYYHTAPVTKFCFHTLSYLAFLALFSYFILIDLAPLSVQRPSYTEYVVWGWAATLFIEECRQIATQDPKTLTHKLSGYFESNWNRFDLLMHVMLVASIILRHLLNDADFVWARMFYAVTLSMYFLRFMHVFFVEKNIGPKVIMIRRMLTDLAFFIAILLTVILAYGVAVQALRFPNSTPSFSLLKDVLYKPYWHIYGELFLEELEGEVDNCSYDDRIYGNATSGISRCPEKNGLVVILLAVYMIMTNILLLNLLIAMFSYTFERVQENSEKVWRYYRYSLVYEYFDKPTLAPPLIILTHIYRVVHYLMRRCGCIKANLQTDFRKKLSVSENHVLTAFERAGMENYLLKRSKTDREHIDAKVSSASERIEKVIEDLEQIKEQVGQPTSSSDADPLMMTMTMNTARDPLLLTTTPRITHPSEEKVSALQDKVAGLEKQLSHQGRAMDQMLSMLKDMRSQHQEGRRRHQADDGRTSGDAASVTSVGTASRGAYRRTLYHPQQEPKIEIQDIQSGETSS